MLQIFYCKVNAIAESFESEMLWILLADTWFYNSWVPGFCNGGLFSIRERKIFWEILSHLQSLWNKNSFFCNFPMSFTLKVENFVSFVSFSRRYEEVATSGYHLLALWRQFSYNNISLIYVIYVCTSYNNQWEILCKMKFITITLEEKI